MSPLTMRRALSLAKKRWGKTAFVREDRRTHFNGLLLPRSDAERAEYRAKYEALKAAEPKWKPLEEWDGETPLRVYRDAYNKYNAEKKAWREQSEAFRGLQYYMRFSVGYVSGMFTNSMGSGDSWEAALRAAKVVVE